MNVSLNRRGRIFLILTILVTLIAVPIRVPPLILLSSLMLAYIVAYPMIMKRVEAPNVTMKCEVRHNVLFRGEVDILHITITNHTIDPIPLLQLDVDLPNSFFFLEQPKTYKFTLEPEFTMVLNIPIVPTSRGYFLLGPINLKLNDPIQIFEETLAVEDKIRVRVYPKRLAKQVSQARAKQVFSKILGFFAVSMKGMGTDFHGLREYIRGDPSKIVDWKASARANKLISREFEDEQKLEIVVALDSGATMRGMKYEYVLGMGMELYQGFVDLGKPTGMVIFNDEIVQEYLPSTSPNRMSKIWASIYGLNPKDVYSDYGQLDKWIDANGITNTLIIVIGDLEGDFNEISDSMRNIGLRGNQVIFLDIWGYSFSYERAILDVTEETIHNQYGQVLKNVIGEGLKQSNIFRGLSVKQDMARFGVIYGYVEDRKDNIIDALDRAMYSYFGAEWKSGQ